MRLMIHLSPEIQLALRRALAAALDRALDGAARKQPPDRTGELASSITPPAHPNCRAHIIVPAEQVPPDGLAPWEQFINERFGGDDVLPLRGTR